VVLWGLYFTLGFRAFSRGMRANGLGLLLTIGLPMMAYGFYRAGWPVVTALTPPGGVYGLAAGLGVWPWLIGTVVGGLATLALARVARARCDGDLRRWYDRNQGLKELD
jgi:hypothetical protein